MGFKIASQAITAGTLLKTGSGKFLGWAGVGDGVALSLEIHDGTIAGAKIIDWNPTVAPSSGIPFQFAPTEPIRFEKGLFVIVTGTNVSIAWE